MADVEPTVSLAEALRELAAVAYGDADAAWESPQQLVHDALAQARIQQVTPEVVARALLWNKREQGNVLIKVVDARDRLDEEHKLDQWMLGLLSAAFGARFEAEDDRPSISFHALAFQSQETVGGTQSYHLLIQGRVVAERIIELDAQIVMSSDEAANWSLCKQRLAEMCDPLRVWEGGMAEKYLMWRKIWEFIFGDSVRPILDRVVV